MSERRPERATTGCEEPTSSVDVLVYVEDPGAANFVLRLPAALRARGRTVRLLAGGTAVDYLRERDVTPEIVGSGAANAHLAWSKPQVVLVGTGEDSNTIGLEMVAAARRAGIATIGVVDGPASADRRFRGLGDSPLAFAPDWILVPDEPTRRSFIALGHASERVVVSGHPHYDEIRAAARRLAAEDRALMRRCLFGAVADARPVVVFACEVSTGLDPERFRRSSDYTLTGRGASHGRTETVLEELLDAVSALRPRPLLVLRLHPKNAAEEFSLYASEVDVLSQGGRPLRLLYAADLVVGMTSMLLVEAALLGRPTLSILPRESERDWLPAILDGIVRCVTTRAELRRELSALLRGPVSVAPPDVTEDALGRMVSVIEGRLRA